MISEYFTFIDLSAGQYEFLFLKPIVICVYKLVKKRNDNMLEEFVLIEDLIEITCVCFNKHYNWTLYT